MRWEEDETAKDISDAPDACWWRPLPRKWHAVYSLGGGAVRARSVDITWRNNRLVWRRRDLWNTALSRAFHQLLSFCCLPTNPRALFTLSPWCGLKAQHLLYNLACSVHEVSHAVIMRLSMHRTWGSSRCSGAQIVAGGMDLGRPNPCTWLVWKQRLYCSLVWMMLDNVSWQN